MYVYVELFETISDLKKKNSGLEMAQWLSRCHASMRMADQIPYDPCKCLVGVASCRVWRPVGRGIQCGRGILHGILREAWQLVWA